MENHDNQQLHKIFARQKSFYQEMESVSRKYLQFEQQVYYLPIKDINPEMIVKLDGANFMKNNILKKREDVYIVNGQYQPTGEKSFEKLILQLVQTIPRPKSAFGIIYINTLADSQAYNDFKKVLELLPIEYLINLTKIYVLNASFFNKAFSWLCFGVAISYINKKTVNVDNLKQLSQESHIDVSVFKQMLPKNVLSVLVKPQNHSQNEPKKYGHGICVQQQDKNDISKSIKHDHIATHFLVDNMTRTKSADNQFASQSNKNPTANSKKELTDYEIGPTGSPIIIQMLICFFNNKEEHLKCEGLFRKSVSIDDENIILEELNKKNYNYLETVSNPHIIANGLKRFLFNLKTPIIPYNIFEEFMEKDSDPQFNKIVVEKIKQLPKINRMVIFLLFDFLANSVIPYAEWSKMGMNNLCIVFGPCLMRSETASIRDLIDAKKIIVVTNIIFKQFQKIFGDKSTQMRLKRNSYKEYRISENMQRQSREQKQSPIKERQQSYSSQESPKSQHPEQCKTPTFRVNALLHKTSLFIRQALSKQQSDDDLDQISQEGSIQNIPISTKAPNICSTKPQQKQQNKVAPINLFITPTATEEKSLSKNIQTVESVSSKISKDSQSKIKRGQEREPSST